MPDPLLYVRATVAAAVASAILVIGALLLRRSASAAFLNSVCVAAVTVGCGVGAYLLEFRWVWPPANALDRYLVIVLPTLLCVEWLAGFHRIPRHYSWGLRIILIGLTPRILLHRSVYLSGDGDWTMTQGMIAISVCSALLGLVWWLLMLLDSRSPSFSVPLALGLATQCAAVTVMMAGYIKGGEAAMLIAATLVATTAGVWLVCKRLRALPNSVPPLLIGFGVLGLFGVLFIGHFFGRVSTMSGLMMLLAPLLCWATEAIELTRQLSRAKGAVRLALVSVPLTIVLVSAKRDFDRDMSPLVSTELTRHHPCVARIEIGRSRFLDPICPQWR